MCKVYHDAACGSGERGYEFVSGERARAGVGINTYSCVVIITICSFVKSKWTADHTDRPTQTQIDRQTDRQTHARTNGRTGREADRQIVTHTDGRTDRQAGRQAGRRTGRQTGAQEKTTL